MCQMGIIMSLPYRVVIHITECNQITVSDRRHVLRNYCPKTITSIWAGIVSVVFIPVIPTCLKRSVLKEQQDKSLEYGLYSWLPEFKFWHCLFSPSDLDKTT